MTYAKQHVVKTVVSHISKSQMNHRERRHSFIPKALRFTRDTNIGIHLGCSRWKISLDGRTNNFSLQWDMRTRRPSHRWNGHKTFYHSIECFSLLWLLCLYTHCPSLIRWPSRLSSNSLRIYVSLVTVAIPFRITRPFEERALRRAVSPVFSTLDFIF